MIKFENTEVVGWEAAIRGMRNPMNSWGKSDSFNSKGCETCQKENISPDYESCNIYIGPNDLDLMKRLRDAGTDHRKFMRMVAVYVDITAPLYFFKELDTYKVGTVSNSCSTMHKIAEKEFTLEDFSCEHLISDWDGDNDEAMYYWIQMQTNMNLFATPMDGFKIIIGLLNSSREAYLKTKNKKFWWQMIQLLPSSYNQRRTVMMNYEVLANIYKSRKNHKLDEWAEHKEIIPEVDNTSQAKYSKPYKEYFGFCDWIKTLPYFKLITGEIEEQEQEEGEKNG